MPFLQVRVSANDSPPAFVRSEIPRDVFKPVVHFPLVFAVFSKDRRRMLVGLNGFAEAADVRDMDERFRAIVNREVAPRLWREVVHEALRILGGTASLAEIYAVVQDARSHEAEVLAGKNAANRGPALRTGRRRGLSAPAGGLSLRRALTAPVGGPGRPASADVRIVERLPTADLGVPAPLGRNSAAAFLAS